MEIIFIIISIVLVVVLILETISSHRLKIAYTEFVTVATTLETVVNANATVLGQGMKIVETLEEDVDTLNQEMELTMKALSIRAPKKSRIANEEISLTQS